MKPTKKTYIPSFNKMQGEACDGACNRSQFLAWLIAQVSKVIHIDCNESWLFFLTIFSEVDPPYRSRSYNYRTSLFWLLYTVTIKQHLLISLSDADKFAQLLPEVDLYDQIKILSRTTLPKT